MPATLQELTAQKVIAAEDRLSMIVAQNDFNAASAKSAASKGEVDRMEAERAVDAAQVAAQAAVDAKGKK